MGMAKKNMTLKCCMNHNFTVIQRTCVGRYVHQNNLQEINNNNRKSQEAFQLLFSFHLLGQRARQGLSLRAICWPVLSAECAHVTSIMICICFFFLHFSTWKMRHMQPFTMHCARTSVTAVLVASAAREQHHLVRRSLNWTSRTYERVEGESQNNNHHFSYKCNFQHIFMLYYMKKKEKEFIDMINYLWWFYVLCTFFSMYLSFPFFLFRSLLLRWSPLRMYIFAKHKFMRKPN